MRQTWISLVMAATMLTALSMPTARADTPCVAPCVIGASSNLPDAPGYDPAVAIIHSGDNVTWTSTDAKTHPHVEAALSNCIAVSSTSAADSPPVFFDIVGDSLQTTVGSTVRTCASALGSGLVGFTLAYRCQLHANMNGVIVVLP